MASDSLVKDMSNMNVSLTLSLPAGRITLTDVFFYQIDSRANPPGEHVRVPLKQPNFDDDDYYYFFGWPLGKEESRKVVQAANFKAWLKEKGYPDKLYFHASIQAFRTWLIEKSGYDHINLVSLAIPPKDKNRLPQEFWTVVVKRWAKDGEATDRNEEGPTEEELERIQELVGNTLPAWYQGTHKKFVYDKRFSEKGWA